MIARRWHGRVPAAKAEEYLKLSKDVGLTDYRSTAGNRGAWCLHRREGNIVHIEMFTLWDDLEAIRRFDPGRDVPFPAYAIMAVTGEIRHHLRDRSSCVRAPEATTAEVIPLDDDVPTTASDFGRSEDRVELGQRLSCLGRREREVVYLRFFADLTQDEIARHVGISQMHVSRLLRCALEQMREVVP